ncbi:hypothetical protein E3N88_03878 [Mikania micrantha]|uniref:Uncharacterized protein n=1 Tax=Mikania micrantha TaxID=192012 RepID=A0A5N6PVN0_9ASTR|nr:hypothetical protein E3N88_03878 [Mikania micrantha]
MRKSGADDSRPNQGLARPNEPQPKESGRMRVEPNRADRANGFSRLFQAIRPKMATHAPHGHSGLLWWCHSVVELLWCNTQISKPMTTTRLPQVPTLRYYLNGFQNPKPKLNLIFTSNRLDGSLDPLYFRDLRVASVVLTPKWLALVKKWKSSCREKMKKGSRERKLRFLERDWLLVVNEALNASLNEVKIPGFVRVHSVSRSFA